MGWIVAWERLFGLGQLVALGALVQNPEGGVGAQVVAQFVDEAVEGDAGIGVFPLPD